MFGLFDEFATDSPLRAGTHNINVRFILRFEMLQQEKTTNGSNRFSCSSELV